ncbi:hypothetical protein OG21DRAFT_962961 [Imleria badia]|nr:hypothetical protein OG21DRAFT_962961 [Imleria badia]
MRYIPLGDTLGLHRHQKRTAPVVVGRSLVVTLFINGIVGWGDVARNAAHGQRWMTRHEPRQELDTITHRALASQIDTRRRVLLRDGSVQVALIAVGPVDNLLECSQGEAHACLLDGGLERCHHLYTSQRFLAKL